ncbi:MAG TPA: CpsB/CapC family capsule biosynthesis tyrosine phosphatase [Longimicrobium sp.]|nr:CpsB/CapC family capsule biosynthesis tyrosine phosphatase [Longimicrobium sp.]
MIDFHNHLIPGVDDGAASLDQSRASLEAYRAQGVRAVVATPHLNASLADSPPALEAYLARVDEGWESLRALGAAEFPEVRLERGFEVMLDTPSPRLADPRLRLAGTSLVLVEFPFMSVPPNAEGTLFALKVAGWTPVIAHPERYSNADAGGQAAEGWKRVGALLQVNAGSVLGRYGPEARERAWTLLERGLADYVASDYHARGPLHLAACREALAAAGGEAQARLLMEENAGRLLAGEQPLPVEPLRRRARTLWSRLFGGG